MRSLIPALVIMGVAGCGKSSVGQALCRLNGATPIEGDAFHPPENIRKMSAGIPLTDEDRSGWLGVLCEELRRAVAAGRRPVLACSALKRSYRERLREAVPGLGFVYLELTPAVAARRVAERPGHFMPASMIDSQFATLEAPHGEPLTLVLDASRQDVPQLAAAIDAWWRRQQPEP
ncbi:gluconokinase [Azotobacter vinelandii CA]|uniref:Gluconokinase n=3 Tax=Azotobacter vinelandii TaxID=354 RepID=C1DKQ3_AZOVD|nr:gluconokinase [Azotobacter vinelandii]ACO78905.1 gluconokinase [Azotobacter vinelandii DJ]AGK13571.1 gluconokinase [Azotobacter vinelandii CA]AGK18032.1 gluconokinase [Azotobacter vinelandii CA6]WKN19901.1 gluconokinase [Azotobacter vinelandii]GLK61102.1 gluconokinase [Azotobacter vinelandii]